MKAALIRVGVDHTYGKWNSVADPCTKEFIYAPIPTNAKLSPGMSTDYSQVSKALGSFPKGCTAGMQPGSINLPHNLLGKHSHLDPDYEYLTYGDNGDKRGKIPSGFVSGDLLVFYSGLGNIHKNNLVYAIVGLYVVDKVVKAYMVPPADRHKNAHTRVDSIYKSDIVVFAKPRVSGRLEKYIEIGEYRDRAYRVTKAMLQKWGGLSVKDGYIQRSITPPVYNDPSKFYSWFKEQNIKLIQRNNP